MAFELFQSIRTSIAFSFSPRSTDRVYVKPLTLKAYQEAVALGSVQISDKEVLECFEARQKLLKAMEIEIAAGTVTCVFTGIGDFDCYNINNNTQQLWLLSKRSFSLESTMDSAAYKDLMRSNVVNLAALTTFLNQMKSTNAILKIEVQHDCNRLPIGIVVNYPVNGFKEYFASIKSEKSELELLRVLPDMLEIARVATDNMFVLNALDLEAYRIDNHGQVKLYRCDSVIKAKDTLEISCNKRFLAILFNEISEHFRTHTLKTDFDTAFQYLNDKIDDPQFMEYVTQTAHKIISTHGYGVADEPALTPDFFQSLQMIR
ncbi:MAG: hypothetical protein HAW66_02885 [Shewanella sp.]|nr:hypothetical protein [Shewanella sp.]